jgi:membrane-bound lytic murein transglycosylase A
MKHTAAYVIFLVLFTAGLIAGCFKAPVTVEKPTPPVSPPAVVKPPEPEKPVKAAAALVRVDAGTLPPLFDCRETDLPALELAALKSISYYEKTPGRKFRFGPDTYTAEELKQSLLEFLDILKGAALPAVKDKLVREKFLAYKSIGRARNGSVLFTGYFEPILHGALQKSDKFKWPIYKTPDDLVVIDLGRFRDKYKGERIVGRVEKRELVPYYNRREIDQNNRLAGRNLEIAWFADPVEVFNLHIQGSGIVCYPDKNCIQVSYADANGRSYRSIGKHLQDKGVISEQEMSYQNINKYLREHQEELADILSRNESYVFFRVVPEGPVGAIAVPLTAGRSIATDPAFFPRGALALIKTRRPVVDGQGRLQSWTGFSRLVLNQDAGGAIKGPGRVDIFFGTGAQAELEAGCMKEEGDLYFLVRKKLE